MTATQNFSLPMLQELEPPPLLKLSFVCFCIFLVAGNSRFFDWQLSWTHVPMITSRPGVAGGRV